jgi:hypothetical protein
LEDLLFVAPIRFVDDLLFVAPIRLSTTCCLLFWCLLMEDLLLLVATLLMSCFVSSTGCGVPIWIRSFPLRRVLSGQPGPLLFDAVIQFRGLLLNNVERV